MGPQASRDAGKWNEAAVEARRKGRGTEKAREECVPEPEEEIREEKKQEEQLETNAKEEELKRKDEERSKLKVKVKRSTRQKWKVQRESWEADERERKEERRA